MPRRRACAHNRSFGCAGSDRRVEYLAETAIVVDGPPRGAVLKFREGAQPNKDLKRAPSRRVQTCATRSERRIALTAWLGIDRAAQRGSGLPLASHLLDGR
jgi:hypothetical protein